MITGTGTSADSKEYAIPDYTGVWSVMKPPKFDWSAAPQDDVAPNLERIDCQFTGVVFEKNGQRAEVWAPLSQHEEVQRQAEEANKLYPGIFNTFKSPPPPSPKPDPKATFTLETELDGDEWDLDNDGEDEPEPVSFEDWWFGRGREDVYDEMEKKVAERLKATLLWQGPLDPTKKRNATFNIIRDMGS